MDGLIWLGGIALTCTVAAGVLVAMARRQLAQRDAAAKAVTTPVSSKVRPSAARPRKLGSDLTE